MNSSTSVCYYFANSPKLQQYFERFIDYYKDGISVAASSRRHAIDLSKTRWVERYKAYENYYLLFKCIVAKCGPFVIHICTKISTSTWKMKLMKIGVGTVNLSTKHKVYSQFVVNLITLLIFQNIYQAYCMINKVLSDLQDIQLDIDTEFKVWFSFAVDMEKSVGVEPSLSRTARCWSRYRNNVPGEDSETYYRKVLLQFQ